MLINSTEAIIHRIIAQNSINRFLTTALMVDDKKLVRCWGGVYGVIDFVGLKLNGH
jgi:hypothetical protein